MNINFRMILGGMITLKSVIQELKTTYTLAYNPAANGEWPEVGGNVQEKGGGPHRVARIGWPA